MAWDRRAMLTRAAAELKDGDYVSLAGPLPAQVAGVIEKGADIVVHSETGILGTGAPQRAEQLDSDWSHAGKEPVTVRPGASIFDSATSFGMIRAGRIDVAILEAEQVSAGGDVAPWLAPEEPLTSMALAVDLVHGAKKVIVLMEHVSKDGAYRIVNDCTLPLAGKGVVHRVITDLAVLDITERGLRLVELAAGVTEHELHHKTEPPIRWTYATP